MPAALSKWFAIIPPIVCPVNFFIDAPFGRFTPKEDSALLVDGINSWILMELVAPSTFSYTFLSSPLSPTRITTTPPLSPLHNPPAFLASLYLLHYLNRALISPLRTPSRSKSHIIVPFSAISFNVVNGFLLGAYLSSDQALTFLEGAFDRPLFWVGITLWVFGLVGNLLHDEILLNIRRKAKAKGKGKATSDDSTDDNNGKKKLNKQEHYAIPHGLLYRLISYPNYFCEWIEWFGFALAASPFPSFVSFPAFLGSLTPPHLFLLAEFFTMIPRAYKGHKWYHNKFPDYPKERKAVIPFLF
ncbi:3-oxo-5-alpha-steroid 4-dehydrogenase-domain-containing protein [Abortiporus biennis]|nr:3-oxo-5-alpha-steroid 4-dehydrogenase-domain-containing protein [Abortiporus biennis]